MKRGLTIALSVSLAAAALAGCGDKTPSGQVVATVGKEEITAIDLKNEMGNFSTPDPKIRRQAERQALEAIINRKVLAQAAKKRKIDKSPEFAQQEKRLNEGLLVQTWQGQLVKAVPAPTQDEINTFMTAHPSYYAQHKVFSVDQIRFARPTQAVLEQLRPANDMAAVEAVLAANKVQFARGATRVDALTVPPAMLTEIEKLPAGAVFVLPAQNLLVANVITGSEIVPLPPQVGPQHATRLLKAQRTQEAVRREFGAAVNAGKKDVKYSKAFQPAPAPAAKGAAAPKK